jgi:hypothetical protein
MLGAAPVLSQTTAAVVHKRNINAFVVPSFSKSSRLYRQTSILASSSSSSSSSRDSYGENNDENENEKVLRVPSNLFPGFPSPEKKAASSLVTLMTMAACRVVLDQWCGSRHRSPMYNKLIDYMQKGAPHTGGQPRPIRDGNEWLHELMRHPELDFRLAAVRILETRKLLVYSEFNWDAMNANAREGVVAESVALNKLYLSQLAECTDASDEFCDAEDLLKDDKINDDDSEGG